MSVSLEILLDAASELGRGVREVDWRNAASRAYYAAFHRCQALAHDQAVPVPPYAGVHRAIVEAFTERSNPRWLRGLGYRLEQCRQRRATADYDIAEPFERGTAATVLDDCREILKLANAASS